MISDTELMDVVKESIADTLAIDIDEVTPEAKLFDDLGAESIDVLDLSFRLEKRLGFKVQLEKALGDVEIKTDDAGRLTPESVASIQARLPSFVVDDAKPMTGLDGLKELLTVDTIFGYLKRRLAETPSGPPA